MTLTQIAIHSLRRRKARAAFVLAGLTIGVATVVAVIGFSRTMTHDINHKLEKYGANILILPRTERLSLTYGGLSLGGVSFAQLVLEMLLEQRLCLSQLIQRLVQVFG